MVAAKPTADPGQLEQLARKIRQQAQRIEDSVTDLQRGAGSAQWRGHSADLFKQDVHKDQTDAQSAARQLRAVASALDAGAKEVRDYRAKIAREQAAEAKQQPTAGPPTRAR
jgi:uncharacterized protein YukE